MTVEYKGISRRSCSDNGSVSIYTHVHTLETTSQNDSEYAVKTNFNLPYYGQPHPDDPRAYCNDIQVDNHEYWHGWEVTVTYSSARELATDPTSEPAIITVNTEQFQKVAETDITGYSICNSAGDPFDPPYMIDDSRRVIMISKNMSGHPSWILNYADVVNSDVFTIKGVSYAVGQGKVQRVTIGEDQVRNGVQFNVVTIEIHLQRNGWLLEPLDVGFRQLAYDGTTRINIYNPAATTSETGELERVTAPVPLDGAGKAQTDPTTATAVYGSFIVYETAPFSVLPLT